MPASVVVELAGARVGLIGVTTEDTLTTTIHANVADLAMAPLAKTIADEGARLRKEERAELVVVLAHAGGKCAHFTGSDRIRPLRDGLGDLPCRESAAPRRGRRDRGRPYARGTRARGRGHPDHRAVRLRESLRAHRPRARGLACARRRSQDPRPERSLPEPGKGEPDWSSCDAGDYEGAKVERDAEVERAVRPALDAARARREELLGPELVKQAKRDYDDESALGNLIVDWMLEAVPEADVALTNGGGLRADLPAGPLRYGALFEAFPFDNRVGLTRITGARLEAIVRAHLRSDRRRLLVRGRARRGPLHEGELELELRRPNGQRIEAATRSCSWRATSCSPAATTSGAAVQRAEVELRDELVRDAVERVVRKKQRIDPSEAFTKAKPRLELPSGRPLRCGARRSRPRAALLAAHRASRVAFARRRGSPYARSGHRTQP
jgi:hypothetical protein